MGKPVARPDGQRINFDSPKAPRSAEPDAETRSVCGITCGAPLLLAMLGQLLMVCMSMHANGNFVSCRTISPSWVCNSLGYIDPALAAMPNTVTPKIGTTFPVTTLSCGSQARRCMNKLAQMLATLASTCFSRCWLASSCCSTRSASRLILHRAG
jgi:hypothetical protein